MRECTKEGHKLGEDKGIMSEPLQAQGATAVRHVATCLSASASWHQHRKSQADVGLFRLTALPLIISCGFCNCLCNCIGCGIHEGTAGKLQTANELCLARKSCGGLAAANQPRPKERGAGGGYRKNQGTVPALHVPPLSSPRREDAVPLTSPCDFLLRHCCL